MTDVCTNAVGGSTLSQTWDIGEGFVEEQMMLEVREYGRLRRSVSNGDGEEGD